MSIAALVFLFATLGVAIYYTRNSETLEQSKKIVGIVISVLAGLCALCFAILLVFQIIDLVKYIMRHKIFAAIFCSLILVGGGLTTYFVLTNRADDYFSDSINLIQDNLTELEAAKISGDSTMAKKKIDTAAMTKIRIISQMVAERLAPISVPETLTDYKQAVVDRGNEIAKAAEDTKTWKDLPAQPKNFQPELSSGNTKELFEASTKKISEIKEFGDTAIQRNDKDAMRYIAAKLSVQDHLLNQISDSAICIGAGGTSTGPTTEGDQKGNVWCVEEAIQSVNEISASAVDFVNGGGSAKDSWNNSWDNAQNILGTGITFGEPDTTAEHSPSVQAFYDDCAAKGGIVGGAGTVKTGLPTTEFGYTCEYKYRSLTHGEQPCWDYLTYSGGRYMGGNTGCPVENVLPPIEEAEDAEPQEPGESENSENEVAAGHKWDGTYPISTTVNCASNMPGMPSVFPVQTTVTVSGNVGNDDGTTFSINSGGSGTEVLQYGTNDENGYVSMIGIVNYQFYMDGNVAKLNAIANLNGSALVKMKYEDGSPAGEQVFTFSCSGGAGATRN